MSTATEPEPPPPPKPRGVACPRCGGIRTPVHYTTRRADSTVRVRRCAACSHRFRTVERIQSTAHGPDSFRG